MSSTERAGIDAGGTLIKVAIQRRQGWYFQSFSIRQVDDCLVWLNERAAPLSLRITGGKSAIVQDKLNRQDKTSVPEFLASCNGARHLLALEGQSQLTDFILTNVGTGTSINLIRGEMQEWVGGTGVGGGTLVGLSGLLTNVYDYSKLIRLAAQGHRDSVDLTVSRIYGNGTPPIPGDLTASNFGALSGKTAVPPSADQVASVIGLVAETVTALSVMAAQKAGVDTVVYIGSSFVENPKLKKSVTRYSRQWGITPIILRDGSFCGAVGAALSK
ncbi:type II pantothenate kinase [Sporolactobacillus sp. STCC-11]|uniref:type II pantothenate kinase n=1 Tax=Sporolactobacillus caesalpiniae TaxID=3230362 RepID=UPI003390E05B